MSHVGNDLKTAKAHDSVDPVGDASITARYFTHDALCRLLLSPSNPIKVAIMPSFLTPHVVLKS